MAIMYYCLALAQDGRSDKTNEDIDRILYKLDIRVNDNSYLSKISKECENFDGNR